MVHRSSYGWELHTYGIFLHYIPRHVVQVLSEFDRSIGCRAKFRDPAWFWNANHIHDAALWEGGEEDFPPPCDSSYRIVTRISVWLQASIYSACTFSNTNSFLYSAVHLFGTILPQVFSILLSIHVTWFSTFFIEIFINVTVPVVHFIYCYWANDLTRIVPHLGEALPVEQASRRSAVDRWAAEQMTCPVWLEARGKLKLTTRQLTKVQCQKYFAFKWLRVSCSWSSFLAYLPLHAFPSCSWLSVMHLLVWKKGTSPRRALYNFERGFEIGWNCQRSAAESARSAGMVPPRYIEI